MVYLNYLILVYKHFNLEFTQEFSLIHFLFQILKHWLISKSSKKENKTIENKIKSLGITIKENNESKSVIVVKVDNEEIKLKSGDIIIEVNREIVDSINSFTSLVEKYKKTGRSSLLLKIQRDEETSWVTIKFVDNW